MKAVLFALNAKYIHSSLAPWCLLAGVEAAGPAGVCAEVREGTVNEPERDVLARILDGEPDAVLFSCYLWNIRETLRLAAAVKAARPGAYVVLGGPEVSYNAGEVLAENPQVDYILSGEGERSVPMLLASLAAGRKPEEEAPPIPGLSLRALRGGGRAAQPVCAGVSGEPARAHCVSGDQPGLPVCLRVLPFWAVRQAPLVPVGAGKTEHPDAGALRRAHREIH